MIPASAPRWVRWVLASLLSLTVLTGGASPAAAIERPPKGSPGNPLQCGVDFSIFMPGETAHLPVTCPPENPISKTNGALQGFTSLANAAGQSSGANSSLCNALPIPVPGALCQSFDNPLASKPRHDQGNPYGDTVQTNVGVDFLTLFEMTQTEVRVPQVQTLPAKIRVPGEGPVWPQTGYSNHTGGVGFTMRMMPVDQGKILEVMGYGGVDFFIVRSVDQPRVIRVLVFRQDGQLLHERTFNLPGSAPEMMPNEGEVWGITMLQEIKTNRGTVHYNVCVRAVENMPPSCSGYQSFDDGQMHNYYPGPHSAPGHVGVDVGSGQFDGARPPAGGHQVPSNGTIGPVIIWKKGTGSDWHSLAPALAAAEVVTTEVVPQDLTAPVIPATPVPSGPMYGDPETPLPPPPSLPAPADPGSQGVTDSPTTDRVLGDRIRDGIEWLGDRMNIDLSWLGGVIGGGFAHLEQFLGPLFQTLVDVMTGGFNQVVSTLRISFDALYGFINGLQTTVLFGALLTVNSLEWLGDLLLWLPDAIGGIFVGLLMPTFPPGIPPGYSAPELPGVLTFIPEILTAPSCGPQVHIPDPIDRTFRAPTPPESGCPGIAAWEEGRQPYDNAIGGVAGFRVPLRALLTLTLYVGFAVVVLRAMPWSKSSDLSDTLVGADL